MRFIQKFRTELTILAIELFLMLILAQQAYAADVWDRPLIGYNTTNNITINITNNYYTIYNDTLLWQTIYDMNTSIWNYLSYLDETLYNETQARINNDSALQDDIDSRLTQAQADMLYYNISNPAGYINQSYTDSIYYPLTNPAGYINMTPLLEVNTSLTSMINATNATLTRYIDDLSISISSINDSLNNETVARIANDSLKLNITDQRYNDTALIIAVNTTIKQPTGIYLAWDNTTFWVNGTMLNATIINISKIYPASYNMAISGQDINISSINITFEITQIIVTPPDNTPYRFELTEYPSLAMIDRDRQAHVGVWSIAKNHALNSLVMANISTASSGTYNIMIYYETQNG